MKKDKSLIKVLSIAIIMLFSTSVFAQFDQVGNLLSTKSDAGKILEAYISPYANGMGASLSGGWYNSAKAHKIGGFDLTITANVVIIPTSDKSFNPNDLNLGGDGLNVTITGDESPTVAGKNEEGAHVAYTENFSGNDVPIANFNLPKGTNFGYSFMPMIQLGVGLVKETDLLVRYSPDITYGEKGKIGLWGIGIKHSVKQWIPALKRLPVFELSVQGGYTKLTSTNGLNFQPEFYNNIPNVTVSNIFPKYYSNQEMILSISNTTANLLVSANLPVICIYGGVGFSSSNSNVKLEGNYPMAEVQAVNSIVVDESTAVTDPIDMEIKRSDVRLNAGFRIKMAVVTLHFDYTYADYSIVTAGLGLTLR